MRLFGRSVVFLIGCSVVACSQSPSQPDGVMAGASVSGTAANAGGGNGSGKPEIDPTWANGQLVYMIGAHAVEGARESMPNVYAKAEELYLVVFPQPPGVPPPSPGAGEITLPSGYQPQCNPCFHPGLPPPFVYHDHVITGAPGMGIHGTAGDFKAPWKIILMMYDPTYAASKNFHPLTSEQDIDNAEHTPGILVPLNHSGVGNPFEIETGNLLICPIVSKHA